MEHKKRVLIVHNHYQIPGGEDTVVENEKHMLEKHGHHVVLYTRNNNEIKRFSFLQKLLMPLNMIYNPRTAREIRRIIRDEKIDVVHVHNTLSLISPSVYYAAVGMHIPVVQTLHNFRLICPGATFFRDGHICEDCAKHGLKCAVIHSCYRGSRLQTLACVIQTAIHRMTGIYGKLRYICLTEFNREKMSSIPGVRREQLWIKPNFVSSNEEAQCVDERSDVFVFAGRIDKLKGVEILLESWKRMGKNAPRLLLCGKGPQEDWCKEKIENEHLNIEMMGFVPNDEVRRLIANSRGLILPTQWYEGFPMTIVEAYSVGTPVLGSDFGNVGSLIEEGVTGCRFAPDSPESLVQAVKRCTISRERILEVYKEKYSEEENYRLLEAVYDGRNVGEARR